MFQDTTLLLSSGETDRNFTNFVRIPISRIFWRCRYTKLLGVVKLELSSIFPSDISNDQWRSVCSQMCFFFQILFKQVVLCLFNRYLLSFSLLSILMPVHFRYSAGLRPGWSGFECRQGLGISLFTTMSISAVGPTLLSIQWVSESLSLEVKRPGREADHSPPSSSEIKNAWSYICAPQYAFMAWCSVKQSTETTLPSPLHLPLLRLLSCRHIFILKFRIL
jgi:hypothetical protein